MRQLLKHKINPHNPKHLWIEKNYPGYLHLIFSQGLQAVYEMNKLYPFGFKSGYVIIKNYDMHWFWDYRDLVRARKVLLEKCRTNFSYCLKIYERWQREIKKNIAIYEHNGQLNLKPLSDQELLEQYNRIYMSNIRQMAIGYMADAFLSLGQEDWLETLIQNRLPKIADIKQATAILTAPTMLSYSNEAAVSLYAIGKNIKNVPNQFSLFYRRLQSKATLRRRLQLHTKKYYWVENGYFPKILTAADFAKQLFLQLKISPHLPDIKRSLRQNKQQKQKLLKKLNDPYLVNVIKLSELLTHMQDYRKMSLIRLGGFMQDFFKEISSRTGLSLDELRNTVQPELENILIKGQFDRAKLRKRSKKVFSSMTTQGYVVYEAADYDRFVDENDFFKTISKLTSINGITACPGLATGYARIVKDAKHPGKFKKGNILITNNTTPEFVPLMRLAAAIVTEQGGITTHAAIVSRELGIPCVIGTKIATKVFKDGDVVEVDANTGMVKKIK